MTRKHTQDDRQAGHVQVLLHQIFLAAANGNPGFKAQLILMMPTAASQAAMLSNRHEQRICKPRANYLKPKELKPIPCAASF